MPENKAKPLPPLSQADVARYWTKVTRGEPEECWPWMGGCHKNGYPSFWVRNASLIATRVAWFLENGVDPAPLLIRHKCDRPYCVNPAHLIPGTHKQNSQDAAERGRHNNAFAQKLSVAQAADILMERAAGMSIPALCRKYQITSGSIIPLIKGKAWKAIAGPREEQKRHLTRTVRDEIRAKRTQGATLRSLAEEYHMSIGAIGMLCQYVTWPSDRANPPD